MQYLVCVGGGPSSKTWPRCASHRLHVTSVRFIPVSPITIIINNSNSRRSTNEASWLKIYHYCYNYSYNNNNYYCCYYYYYTLSPALTVVKVRGVRGGWRGSAPCSNLSPLQ